MRVRHGRSVSAAECPEDGDVDAGCHEHYLDAALYDYEYRRRRADVNFYKNIARDLVGETGRILELACGSGRITIPLARAGYEVLGLDLSASMLQQAAVRLARIGRASRARVALVRADMRRFSLGARFPLIIMGFNSFEHLYTRVDVSACLDQIRRHLAPGGYFVFDVQNPHMPWLCRDPRKRWARTRFTHPETKRRLIYSTNHDYDPVSQIAVIRLYYRPCEPEDGPERVVTLSQRKFFPAELEALLDANGFRIQARYGDFAGDPLDGEAVSQVLVCQVRESPSQIGRTAATARADGRPEEPELVLSLGVVRDGKHLVYFRQGGIWRTPLVGGEPELLAEPSIAVDAERHVYYLDQDGDLVRVRRPAAEASKASPGPIKNQ